MSKLGDQIREAAAVFDELHTTPALIGGLALAAHKEAEIRETALGRLRIVGAEGLIAFKLQAFVNDPS